MVEAVFSTRQYLESDRAACLRLYDSNVPEFFAAMDRQAYAKFLVQEAVRCSYLVVECDSRVVACGGYYAAKDGGSARLCWGMVCRNMQGRGLGKALTEARIQRARAIPGVTEIGIDTSQRTQRFYERLGFGVRTIVQNGNGPGLDSVTMILHLPA